MNNMKICCFTGHRDIPDELLAGTEQLLRRAVKGLADNRGVTTFRAGGARGFDCSAAKAVIELRDSTHPHLRLELYLPCTDQAAGWTRAQVADYKYTIAKADLVTYVSEKYTSGCMHKRNRTMVDGAGYCVAFLEGNAGGTAYTVDYARRNGLVVYNLRDILLQRMEKNIETEKL